MLKAEYYRCMADAPLKQDRNAGLPDVKSGSAVAWEMLSFRSGERERIDGKRCMVVQRDCTMLIRAQPGRRRDVYRARLRRPFLLLRYRLAGFDLVGDFFEVFGIQHDFNPAVG